MNSWPEFTMVNTALVFDIIDAKRYVKRCVTGKHVTYSFMVNLIKKFESDLSRTRTEAPSNMRYIRYRELVVLFAEDFHNECLRKYESYTEDETN